MPMSRMQHVVLVKFPRDLTQDEILSTTPA